MFAITSFFIPYFMWSDKSNITFLNQDISILLRFTAGVLSFGLIIHDMWSKKFQYYQALYWHFTLMYSLSFFTSFLFLYNNGSHEWLINMALSLFLLATLVDWVSFVVLLSIGSSLGYWLNKLLLGENQLKIIFGDTHKLYLFLYVAFFSTLIGMLFSRNREHIQKSIVDFLEKRVKERTIELEEALILKKEFLTNLSHEIRIPITGIIAFCKGLYENWGNLSEEKRLIVLEKLNSAVDKFYTFVDNMLDLSKLDSGKVNLNLERIDIEELIKEVLEETDTLLKLKKDLQVQIKLEASSNTIDGDRFKIKQVIRNLISNSIKYSNNGDIIIIIKEGKETRDDGSIIRGLIISISDEGVGFPEEELDLIFNPFTPNSHIKSHLNGRGLSLSVSRKIVEAHLGKMWASNNKNKGATFYFAIPKDLKFEVEN